VSVDSASQGTPIIRWLLIIFVIAATLRVGWVCVRYVGGDRAAVLEYPDEGAYVLSAKSLVAGEGLIDEFGYRATYMPGYPAFLAVFQHLSDPLLWTRVVQAILAALVVPAGLLLARCWWGDVRVAVLAGLAVAFDPFLVFFSGLLLSEALFTVVLIWAWMFVSRLCITGERVRWSDAVLIGLLLLVAVLLRPAAMIFVLCLPLVVLIVRQPKREALLVSGMSLLIVVVGLLPWGFRNQRAVGEFLWLTTRGGISFYDGLQPGATGGSDLAHTKTLPEVRSMDELQWNAYFRERAWQALRDDPMRAVKLAGRKFLRTWSLIPNVETHRQGAPLIVSAIWMGGVLLLALVGFGTCLKKWRCWLTLLTPVIAVTLLHMVFVGSVRYRVPVMPMVLVVSAVGAVTLFDWCRQVRLFPQKPTADA
jgi:hypothetical protein